MSSKVFVDSSNMPNDALILATCKHHGIPALASFDPDFVAPCEAEGIALLRSVADFEAFQQKGEAE